MQLITFTSIALSVGTLLVSAAPIEDHVSVSGAETNCFTRWSSKKTSTVRTKYTTESGACTATVDITVATATTSASIFTSTVFATTTETETTIVPTSSGFLPIRSSLPGSKYSGDEGLDPVDKRDLEERSPASNGVPKALYISQMYENEVNCYATVTECASTVTQTATIAVTTAPVTVSTTATQTLTTTTTLYDVCAKDNLADRYDAEGEHHKIVGGIFESGVYSGYFSGAADSAYDCCASAVKYAEGTYTQIFAVNTTGFCLFVYGTDVAQSGATWRVEADSKTDPVFVVGNLYNGYFDSAI